MSSAVSEDRFEQGRKSIYLSIFFYLVLSISKIIFGLSTESKGLVADGWNNVSDVISSLVILLGLIIARKPADQEHRYGHFRAETAAALVAAILMVIVGIDVLKSAVGTLLYGTNSGSPDPSAFFVAFIAAIIMFSLYRYNKRIAERTNNFALMAAAYDNRSDALVSVGAAVGVVISWLGWTWVDLVIAVIIGFIILKTAWQVGHEAVHSLMDGFDATRLSEFEEKVEQVEGIREVLDLRARYYGSAVHVDVTIGVDRHLTVVESHELTEKVEEELIGYDGIERVYVHVEPVSH